MFSSIMQYAVPDSSSDDMQRSDTKDDHIRELERQLESVSEELNMEKQKVQSLEEVSISLQVKGIRHDIFLTHVKIKKRNEQVSVQSQHMQELEGQLKSVNEELKMVQKVGMTCTPI